MHSGTALSNALCLALLALISTTSTAWKLPFFNFQQENEISLHPLSPPEDNLRFKRQTYQLSVNGDAFVTVDKYGGGQAESGAWGPWTRDGECSRTCGGGVQTEKRLCNGDCSGPSVRYQSCNLDSCPEDSQDFREEQCETHNDDVLDGKYYKWVPFKGSNKCELTCKPHNESFYYKWADKVVDGTRCDQTSDDICVDGICLPLGCDGKLGSVAKVDKCGVCNGTGNTCKSQEGLVKESGLSKGYNDIIVLPAGATAIRVEETQQTSNSLALKNESGHYFLNGNNRITLGDQEVIAGGTVFKYQKPKPESGLAESLTAKGPLKDDITIQLLYQGGSTGSSVKYQFSIPLDEDIQFVYKPGEWSACSVSCGKGIKTRSAFCTDAKTGQKVGDEVCEENNATRPDIEKPCVTVDCDAEWFIGDWEECSDTCGDHGLQYRVVYCHKVFASGKRMTVDDENCTSVARPAVRQTCNRFSCPEWHAGPWSACSEKCGDAKQYRSVTCRSEKTGEEGKLLPADACPPGVELETIRYCNLGPCEGLHFVTTDWDLCERCTDTEETRNVTCQDQTGRPYPREKCLDDKVTEIPPDVRPCATALPCIYQWHVSEWSKCSTECGHGHKDRKVHCALNELGTIKIVEDNLCSSEKPNVTEECINEAKCTGTWYTGPWSNCTVECGGGKQDRFAVCLNYDKKPVPEWCGEETKPVETQECNVQPCPTCFDSDFGCCPDNVTFAQGDWFEGCSNCSLSEFGCCNDNITEATGPNSLGCDEYIEPEPASGEEPETAEKKEDAEKECEVTNEETGEVASILCAAANETLEIADLLLGNETEDGNATKHCSKTEFGCCPDWYTPAEGKDFLGCPEFILGACNETQHGCCLDNVTLARGPNFEGCGEPVCAASRFGCCKDRKTIAFGPHYLGCERSAFPCENSQFGCCPDGETGALDKNNTGCGVQCLLTKYGCCPDGTTVSKGVNNEGCGCEYSQYGCCPDGKSSAKGAGYYGCPESCAQSQHGCCPDGKTAARGPNKEGCPCQYTRFGCCPDGETTALGPKKEGCDDCRYAKHGCCPDGITKALGPNGAGCPTTTKPPFIVAGTVAPAKIIACNLPQDKGELCQAQYALRWFYDSVEGRCSQFWFGGCAGNENNFASKEECETVCVEPPELGRCYLPKVEGPQKCNDLKPRYWYDYTTKRCDAFWWRGCLGNANNFDSWESCQRFCSNVGPTTTISPPTADPFARQREYEQRRQEEDARQRAAQTQQGQTEEEARRRAEWEQRHRDYFESVKKQKEEAQRRHELDRVQHTARNDPVCSLLVNSGECNSYEDMWYFNVFNQECHQFIYSGCNGNENRFKNKADCLNRCGYLKQNKTQPQVHISDRESCNLPKDVGTCNGKFDAYFYNPSSDSCEIFQYSGCGGNRNRFQSKEQCQFSCSRVQPVANSPIGQGAEITQPLSSLSAAQRCEAAPDKGPCTRFTTMWFFKKTDGTCTRFYYGGCKGNGNLFKTEQECKDICGSYLNVCDLPAVKGPCGGHHQKFYYNKEAKECQQFEFSGCLGNGNNFATKEQCEERCSRQ
uniref:Papilin n=1 Tax=Bursaphelenchus xylophilus TaxID=6326 RepID=A0A1I7RSD0_BURXY